MTKKIMPKKSKDKSEKMERAVTISLMVIFVAIFFISLGIFHIEKQKADSAEKKLQEQFESYKNVVSQLNSAPKTTTEPEQATVQAIKDEYSADAGISFSECGLAGYFKNEKWYQDFLNKLTANSITTKNISGACLSADGSMLILIAQAGAYCEGPKMYRYNTLNDNLAMASILNKGVSCLGSLKSMGKREGNIIHLVAPGNGECRREEYYDYDFIKNIVELKKSRSLCDGDSNWKVTEY